MSDDDTRFDRRNVLKTAGAAALAAAGLGVASDGVAAMETKRRLADAYADERRLRAAFDQHAGGVLTRLREAGFVGAEFDPTDRPLALDPEAGGLAPTATDGRAGVTAVFRDGTPTAIGMVSTSSDGHEISLYVQPERDEAYAFVEPAGGGQRLLATAEDVEPVGTAYTSCEECCAPQYVTKVTWNCTDRCRIYDTDCGCTCGCYDPSCDEFCDC